MEQVNKLVEQFVEELQPLVTDIENDIIPITKDNYGRYYELLANFQGKNTRLVMAIALIRCNANENGVIAALKLCNPEAGATLEMLVEQKKIKQ